MKTLVKYSLSWALAGIGLAAQQAYPIYGPKAQAVYQPQGLAAGQAEPARVKKVREPKAGEINPSMLPDGEVRSFITYPVTTDGYKITGTLQAVTATGFTVGPKVQNATVEGGIYPISIYNFDANGNYKYLNTFSSEQSFYFNATTNGSGYYYIKIVYRHGYNTINTWQTANRFPSGVIDNLFYLPGRFINEIRDKAVDQGGLISTDYILMAANELPRAGSAAAVHTQFRRNYDWWLDNGNSKLETVELYDAVGGIFSQMSIPFELFFVNNIHDADRLRAPVPNMGMFDFQKGLLPETVGISNWALSRFTKTEWKRKILPLAWEDDPDGYAAIQSAKESLYAVAWPSFMGSESKVALDGGRFFVDIKANLAGF